MQKVFLLILLIISFLSVNAQIDTNQQVIGSAGEELKSNKGSVNFTVGEPIIQTYLNRGGASSVTQGFHQTFFEIIDVSKNANPKNEELEIKVWPNPTVQFLNVDFGDQSSLEHLEVNIIDAKGALLADIQVQENLVIDLRDYPVSSYFLRIYDTKNAAIKLYKVIKQ